MIFKPSTKLIHQIKTNSNIKITSVILRLRPIILGVVVDNPTLSLKRPQRPHPDVSLKHLVVARHLYLGTLAIYLKPLTNPDRQLAIKYHHATAMSQANSSLSQLLAQPGLLQECQLPYLKLSVSLLQPHH